MSHLWYIAAEIGTEIRRWLLTAVKEKPFIVGGLGFVGFVHVMWILLALGGVLFDSAPGNFGRVAGIVTVNGLPVAGVQVRFEPVSGGVASYGITDGSGRYDLQVGNRRRGAVLGRHVVRLSTGTLEQGADGGETLTVVHEIIPECYSVKSELVAEVAEGRNHFDWNIDLR